ncbi:MAG: hypothetical protein M1834_003026 [Cirrosporium novae-zelandiae]|nr:MAG: hypothetical protein M1834_003026 [Cirrosporium novae-zelandiae]
MPSPSVITKRGKRASRACDHCRWKRLKCSDNPDGPCANCNLYGTSCDYTTTYPSQSAAAKRKKSGDHSNDAPEKSNASLRPRAKKAVKRPDPGDPSPRLESVSTENGCNLTFKASHDGSCEPNEVPMSSDSPSRTPQHSNLPSPSFRRNAEFSDDIGTRIFGAAVNTKFPIEPNQRYPDHLKQDEDTLGKRMEQYISIMLTEVDITDNDPLQISEGAGFPSQATAATLVTAFFKCINPLWPIIDEPSFRIGFQEYYQNNGSPDELWLMLFKLVLALGVATCGDLMEQEQSLRPLRDTLFSEAMSSMYLVYGRPRLRSIQKPTSAWLMCGTAIRLSRAVDFQRTPHQETNDIGLIDRVIWSCFILESHLALLQCREDLFLHESSLRNPDEIQRRHYPIFCYRLQLARLMHRLRRLFQQGTLDPTTFPNEIQQLDNSLLAWQESLPIGFRPGQDIFASAEEYQLVLLLHIECCGLAIAMFVSLSTCVRLFPGIINLRSNNNVRIQNHATICVSTSRLFIQAMNLVSDTAHLRPNVMLWLNANIILAPFSILYHHVIKQPYLLSARSDFELLCSAAQHFRRFMTSTDRNNTVASLMISMFKAASQTISQARARPLANPETLSLYPPYAPPGQFVTPTPQPAQNASYSAPIQGTNVPTMNPQNSRETLYYDSHPPPINTSCTMTPPTVWSQPLEFSHPINTTSPPSQNPPIKTSPLDSQALLAITQPHSHGHNVHPLPSNNSNSNNSILPPQQAQTQPQYQQQHQQTPNFPTPASTPQQMQMMHPEEEESISTPSTVVGMLGATSGTEVWNNTIWTMAGRSGNQGCDYYG